MFELTQWYDKSGNLYTHESDPDYQNQLNKIGETKLPEPEKISVSDWEKKVADEGTNLNEETVG